MKLRPFELTLVTGFGILAIAAMVLLSMYEPDPDESDVLLSGPVEIWGTLPPEPVEVLFQELSQNVRAFNLVSYRYIPPEQFDNEFVQALADRTGPDLLLLSHEELVAQRARLLPLSYEQYSLRTLRDRFLEAGEIFALHDGVYALPVALDPLVMYWNRDALQNKGLLTPPKTWEEIVSTYVPTLIERDFDRTIRRAVLAMGEVSNIQHVHPIISMLLLQAGSALVSTNADGYVIRLNEGSVASAAKEPLTQALDVFTRFNNPVTPLYTWNRAQVLDRDAFVREDLIFYFGFGSEARDLGSRNPNLNYDIAPVPQGAGATQPRTYGRVYGAAIVRAAANPADAMVVQQVLTDPTNAARLANQYLMAPVTRAAIAAGSTDVYGSVIYAAAPTARGWLNPKPQRYLPILERTVGAVNLDRATVSGTAQNALTLLGEEY